MHKGMNKHEIQPFFGHGCFEVYALYHFLKNQILYFWNPWKGQCNPIRLKLYHFSIHATTCQPCIGKWNNTPTMLLAQVVDVGIEIEHEHNPIR